MNLLNFCSVGPVDCFCDFLGTIFTLQPTQASSKIIREPFDHHIVNTLDDKDDSKHLTADFDPCFV